MTLKAWALADDSPISHRPPNAASRRIDRRQERGRRSMVHSLPASEVFGRSILAIGKDGTHGLVGIVRRGKRRFVRERLKSEENPGGERRGAPAIRTRLDQLISLS